MTNDLHVDEMPPSREHAGGTAAFDTIGKAVVGWSRDGLSTVVCRPGRLQGLGSVPHGQMLALNELGAACGQILGGAGAAQVREVARQLLDDRQGPSLGSVTVAVHGDAVTRAGLSCGGQATIVVQRVDAMPTRLWSALAERRPVALATVLDGTGGSGQSRAWFDDGTAQGDLGGDLDANLGEVARSVLAATDSAVRVVETGGATVLVESFVSAPYLVIVGAGDLSAAIIAQASVLGWPAEAADDYESADELLERAGPSAALVVLSHAAKVDAPVLEAAVRRRVTYLGALGSRRTQAARADRLRALGVSDDEIGRIRGPIGLNLGGQRPAEVALAVCAEILACRTGRDGAPLVGSVGPIRS
jgi:xanthine dehydrogenase accessory factor